MLLQGGPLDVAATAQAALERPLTCGQGPALITVSVPYVLAWYNGYGIFFGSALSETFFFLRLGIADTQYRYV